MADNVDQPTHSDVDQHCPQKATEFYSAGQRLMHYHTITTFNDPEEGGLRKHFEKRRKC